MAYISTLSLLIFTILSLQLEVVRCIDAADAGHDADHGEDDEPVGDELRLQVHESQRTCLYEDIEHDGTYSFQYKVLKHKQQQVDKHVFDVSVTSPSGKPVYSSTGRQSDEAQFHVLFPGTYTFCFINRNIDVSNATNHTQSSVYLQFGLRLSDGGLVWKERREQEQKELASEIERNEIESVPIKDKMARIFAYGEQIIQYQSTFRQAEAVDSEHAEFLGSQVNWWSIAEAVVIVCTGFGQVLAMKFFFTDRREMTVIAFDIGHHGVSTLGVVENTPSTSFLPMRP